MWKDVQKRRFITVGFAAFVLMIPLAVTSTAGMIRRLGGRRWQMLHRAIYVSAVLGVIHYYWLVKSDVRKPLAVRGDRGNFVGISFGNVDLWARAEALAPAAFGPSFRQRKRPKSAPR